MVMCIVHRPGIHVCIHRFSLPHHMVYTCIVHIPVIGLEICVSLVQCVAARETWHACFAALQLSITAPSSEDTLVEWWSTIRQGVPTRDRKGMDSLVILISWNL